MPLAFLAAFFVYPLAALFVEGFRFGPDEIGGVFSRSRFWRTAWFTVWQAVVSTAVTLLISLPLSAVVGRYRFRGRSVLLALVTVPFVLPTVVVASAFLASLERLGLADRFGNSAAVIIAAHVFFNVAVVVRTVGGYWRGLDDRPEQAARVLGAGPIAAFRHVTLPRLRPAILAATSIILLFTMTSFGVVLLLGGPRRGTLETEIYRFALNRTDFGTAAVLAIVQLVAVLGLLVVNSWLARRLTQRERRGATARPRPRGRQWLGIAAAVVPVMVFLTVPMSALVERSFRSGGSYSWANYRALTDRPPLLPVDGVTALSNSVRFAVAAMAIAVGVGVAASVVIASSSRAAHLRPSRAERAMGWVLDVGLLLPLGTSAVTLGFGFLVALDEPVDLRPTWIIIALAQSLIGVPFVVRAVVPVLRSIDGHVREAAAALGASPSVVRREIELPMARSAIGVGAVFAFAVALGEFGATSFVGRSPDRMTVPLAIGQLLGQPGQQLRGQAMALSTILMVATIVVIMIIDRNDRAGVL
ncbi:MAG: iron ABC transporter permease [Acidimicrobiales bacterium]|nr:iron ABC transporter permease [Acidimicrobiales bacterium]